MAGDQLPPFIGYLPPAVDGVLLELVNMSHRDYPPRAGRTGAQLSESRRVAVDSLHEVLKEKMHQRATEVVLHAARTQSPFGLYLRNFGLGPRTYPARNDQFGLPQVVTLSGPHDSKMRGHLEAAVVSTLPVVGIRNPVGLPQPPPEFVVADEDWEALATVLVRNAGMIVVYFFGLTTGVAKELDLIRAARKQTSTLVVVEQEDPFAGLDEVAKWTGAERNESVSLEGSLDDFPQRATIRGDVGIEELRARLAEMAHRPHAPPIDREPELPPEFLPPEPLRNLCTDLSTHDYDKGYELLEAKRFEEAEDMLYRAFAFACWSRFALGRVMTLTALAQVNLVGFGAKGDAGEFFRMALETCEGIRSTSPTAAAMYPHIEQALLRLEQEAKAR